MRIFHSVAVAQSNTDQLVKALIARGHDVGVGCTLSGGEWTEIRSRLERRVRGATPSQDVVDAPDVGDAQNGLTEPIAKSL